MTNFLNGYKTYIVALLVGIQSALFFLEGDPVYGKLFLAIATIAVTLRKAIQNTE